MLGKHSKEITCGAWSQDNRLALGSKDKVTISTADGDELERTRFLKKEPVEIQFMTKSFQKQQEQKNAVGSGKVSINMDGQRILLYDLEDPDNQLS